MAERTAHLQLIPPAASPEEAAAIVAALERFWHATAPASTPPAQAPDAWSRAAILEGLRGEAQGDPADPWINT
jgi:hypothetical protein